MHVVHVITGLGQGGAEAMLEKLIRTSISVSPEVSHEVVSLLDTGIIGPRLMAMGVPVTPLHLGGLAGTIRGIVRLRRILKQLPGDAVVQTWLYHADLLGGCVARMCGLRNVYWNLRVTVDRANLNPATYVVVRLCAVLSRFVPRRIVNCGPAVLDSHAAIGYARARCVVIGNGFEPDRFNVDRVAAAPIRASLGVPADALLIGTVARMHAQKDFPTLARAAAELLTQISNAYFLWVGAGVDTDAELTRLMSRLGLGNRVVRLGLRSDVSTLMNAMDVYCLPSRGEGFPNALGEAMSCELPCVSTNAGDAAYLLGTPEWIVPTSDPAALSTALVRVCRLNDTVRRALGVRNRERVAREFGIQAAWQRYLALYLETSARVDSPVA